MNNLRFKLSAVPSHFMNFEDARKLIQMYVDGWKENNIDLICKPLAKNCIIIESHGPTYKGLNDVKEWVKKWISENFKVDKWNITSFYLFEDISVFEWQFAFFSPKTSSRTIDGISVVKFRNNKISFLREYRTTKSLYRRF